MLTPFDDYPIHQAAVPIAQAGGGHADHYDRFWFNGYTEDMFFAVAHGQLPEPRRDRRRLQRRPRRRAALGVRLRPGAPSTATRRPDRPDLGRDRRADADHAGSSSTRRSTASRPTSRSRPARPPTRSRARPATRRRPAAVRTCTRMTQFGHVVGDASRPATTRSRSTAATVCGTQGPLVGHAARRRAGADGARRPQPPQICFLWAPLNFPDDACSTTSCSRTPTACRGRGRRRSCRSSAPTTRRRARRPLRACSPASTSASTGSGAAPVASDAAALTFRRRRRRDRADRARAAADVPHARRRLQAPDVGPRALARRARRRRRGGTPVEHRRHRCSDHLHVQQVMRATWGDRVGLGVLEQIVIGPHEPTASPPPSTACPIALTDGRGTAMI